MAMPGERPNINVPRWLRSIYPFVPCLVLGLMLFAPLAPAAQTSVIPQLSPVVAFSAEEMPAGCQQQGAAGRNACLADCLSAAQVLDPSYQSGSAASSAANVVFHPLQFVALLGASLAPASTHLPGLPLFLRFERLLN